MASTQHQRFLANAVRALDKLGSAGGAIATLVIWLLAITVTYDVILRSMGTPTLWASEVSIYLMVALAFLGIGATQNVDGHFRVTFVRDLCPPKVRAAFDIFSLIANFIFAAGFTYGAWKLVAFSIMLDFRTATILELPMWLLQGLLLLGGVLLILATCRDLLRFIIEGHQARDAKSSAEVI
ncbi:TRAP-type mannitol/chloroaromatic compound transport system, small permease component [Pusillimonas sp. T7-7]|uniref:TRAP transporter small permease subunit n=1 Tax=Pusillimonas sp. (strain T7-7) TaxID=1007105 RepID=UPI0002085096|nr:TRAP transporter small permease [Pusillimonas sp. T7-7]AEC21255.1 TRAP-type mannitol/chloroaromatic compound transport system, small permease component [Pusillimonas sp. T7-7]